MNIYYKFILLYLILLLGLYIIKKYEIIEKFRVNNYHIFLVKPRYYSKQNKENKDYYYITDNLEAKNFNSEKDTIVHHISCHFNSAKNKAIKEIKNKFNNEYFQDKTYNLYKIPIDGYKNRRRLRKHFTTINKYCKLIK